MDKEVALLHPKILDPSFRCLTALAVDQASACACSLSVSGREGCCPPPCPYVDDGKASLGSSSYAAGCPFPDNKLCVWMIHATSVAGWRGMFGRRSCPTWSRMANPR